MNVQVDAEDVQVVKASLSTMLSAALYDDIRGKNRVGYDPERVTKSMEESIGGLVKEAVPLPEGEIDRIQARLPARGRGSGVFEAGAVVRNCTLAASDGGFRLGLEFEALSAPATAALGDFLG